jgi:hypothetical protein
MSSEVWALLTEKQAEVARFICDESIRSGRGIGVRDVCDHFGWFKVLADGSKRYTTNSAQTHLEAIKKKTGSSIIMFEQASENSVKANCLRAATMAGGPVRQNNEHCRNGSGYSIVVVGESVAFTIFSEVGIVKHDVIALSEAIAYCDRFKIPAEMAVIDRIAKLAEKQAKMAASKVTA